ncbi:MAG: 30S ribosomal protein S16 [Candidatus Omnitrophota bacterium]|jgi:small subunit ribosomal protein S16
MSVCIRLKRIGKNPKGRSFFRFAVFNKQQGRDSRSIEELGYYDPTKDPELIKINKERLEYWLSCGAKMSETVKSLVNRADKISQTATQSEPEPADKAATETVDKATTESVAEPQDKAESDLETEDKTRS